ncbi:MAG: dihydroorotate dehydrogenase electron transfer subunit [Lachnospiraceae bacterium]|nr:dihydroorotate dehydrogenase electron transfer subunit [Lachnospiraceae bacterium]
MSKTYVEALILSQSIIAKDIYSLWIKAEDLAENAKPGQFINVYTDDPSLLLPRPISICEINKEQGTLRLVYRIAGKGTKCLSRLTSGDEVTVMGPLGNGFPLISDKKAMLIGGGIGIPPMLELAKNLVDPVIVAGYRDEIFLKNELEKAGQLHISTENGLMGTRGNVMDAIAADRPEAEVIYACGPLVMLTAVKKYAKEKGITAYISLEERMACGVGACLGCVCRTVKKDAHTHVNNARVCTEGPVFVAEEVDI